MKKNLKIVMLASECVPFAKTGGLADVIGALPGVLKELGHEVIVILPKYASVDLVRFKIAPFLSPLGVWMGDQEEWASVYSTELEGVSYFFIEQEKYFHRWGFYHDAEMHEYLDNPRRFGFFTRAGLQLCRDMGFQPHIVHAHDWQTALAPGYLKIWHWNDPALGSAASVLTIHNFVYQGVYDAKDYPYLGLQQGNFTSDKFEDHGKINFLKGGIHYADALNTVSPSYAEETRKPESRFGLAYYLNGRGDDYVGILNGVDYRVWDPSVDKIIPQTFSVDNLSGKAICKQELQKRFYLNIDPKIPLIGLISRFAHEKGLDLLASVIEDIVRDMRVQFVILGFDDHGLSDYFGQLPARYPGTIGSYIGFNEELSHWIEAGADFFLMPSLHEACGLNQIYSLRYGTLPIVRATGGLDDTVQQYDESTGEGTGFKFWEPSGHAVYYSVGWAVSTYFDRPEHMKKMIQAAMAKDYSWSRSAEQYVQLYERAMANKRTA